ncbi:hypothetical protein [Dyella flagellata]|uniref:Uncharacterized protein n=1 Tax=Dyella flagellata TaxID=1867833 RepID=A0ABQ5XAD0_9GAMM|nr:hypothetical protein [Dyella flagellata]GLQ88578.1 hypothetical protein GCM10007898_21480 [Dyella flagellata]
MTSRPNFYLWIAALFAGSLVTYLALPRGELIRQIAALPLVGSLFGLLVKIALDEASHQRDLIKIAVQNNFSLAANSHMASVAFDKHAEFSEKYAIETQATLVTLFRKGPTDEALEHAHKLYLIRSDFAVWLTRDIDTKLEEFEAALREVGASAHYVYNNVDARDRQEKLDGMYRTFAQIIGMKAWNDERLTDEKAIASVFQHLRVILGMEELTKLRQAIVSKAFEEVEKK